MPGRKRESSLYAVIIGARDCPHCEDLVKYAEKKKIPHRYLTEDDLPGLAKNLGDGLIPQVWIHENGKYRFCGIGLEKGIECLEEVKKKNR